MRLTNRAAILTALCLFAIDSSGDAAEKISRESILKAGSIYGFVAVCAKDGYVMSEQAKAFVRSRDKSKLFDAAAATEMKGFSEGYCATSYKNAFGKNGADEEQLGFQPVVYVAGNASKAQVFAMTSAAEIAYMEKVCAVGMVLTPNARRLVKKSIDTNRPWFTAIYSMAVEDYGKDGMACDLLMFDEYNTTSEKTKRLGFHVWQEECPAEKMGQAGCKME